MKLEIDMKLKDFLDKFMGYKHLCIFDVNERFVYEYKQCDEYVIDVPIPLLEWKVLDFEFFYSMLIVKVIKV